MRRRALILSIILASNMAVPAFAEDIAPVDPGTVSVVVEDPVTTDPVTPSETPVVPTDPVPTDVPADPTIDPTVEPTPSEQPTVTPTETPTDTVVPEPQNPQPQQTPQIAEIPADAIEPAEEEEIPEDEISADPEERSIRVMTDVEKVAMLYKYAADYGVSDYIQYLYAIMIVESGGVYHPNGGGLMGISDSAGGISIGEEESIKEGCRIFAEVLNYSLSLGCDVDTAVQSYNYGPGFAAYVAANGGRYSFQLAEAFAREKAGGAKTAWPNPIAISSNGGWRYLYGNMFYVACVHSIMNGSSDFVMDQLTVVDIPYVSKLLAQGTPDEYAQAPGEKNSYELLRFLLLNSGYTERTEGSVINNSDLSPIKYHGFVTVKDISKAKSGDIIMVGDKIGIYNSADRMYLLDGTIRPKKNEAGEVIAEEIVTYTTEAIPTPESIERDENGNPVAEIKVYRNIKKDVPQTQEQAEGQPAAEQPAEDAAAQQ